MKRNRFFIANDILRLRSGLVAMTTTDVPDFFAAVVVAVNSCCSFSTTGTRWTWWMNQSRKRKKREREREREKERDGCVRTVTSRRRLISICSTRVCRIKERERERERGQRATGVIEWPTFSARRGVKRAANLIIDQLTSPECPEASNHQLPPARPHTHTHTQTHTNTHKHTLQDREKAFARGKWMSQRLLYLVC